MTDRATEIALFRYALIREAADPALSHAGRGRMVRTLAGAEHPGPDGTPVRVSRNSLNRFAWSTGLVEGWDRALLDTYKMFPTRHFPGQVLADLAVAVADGARSIADLAVLRDQPDLFGSVASPATAWRRLDRVGDKHLARLRDGRAAARSRAWAAGAGPDLSGELHLDFDATIVIAHSPGLGTGSLG
jgi:hypothetical protein